MKCMQVDGNRKQSTAQPIQHFPHNLSLVPPPPARWRTLTQTIYFEQSEKGRAANAAQIHMQSAAVRKAGADAVKQVPRYTSIAEGKRHPLPQGENIAEQRVVHNASWSQSFRSATARGGACRHIPQRTQPPWGCPARPPAGSKTSSKSIVRAPPPGSRDGWRREQIVLALTHKYISKQGRR